jgi:FkbM family methyltransferase
MLSRCRSAGLRIMREVASFPLQMLGTTQRGRALETLTRSMISKVNAHEGTLSFMTPTPLLQARANSALSKEPDTIAWIDGFESGDIFWDVGANVGVFSLYAARRRAAHVLAFEPSADNYMILCRNVEINALGERISPYCIALAGHTELGVLNLTSRDMGAALNQFGRRGEISRYSPGSNGLYVQGMIGYTIDDFLRHFEAPFPTHLKLDVDGLEWQILQGASETLGDPRLQSIMVELSISDQVERERAITCLSDMGFKLVRQGEIQESGSESAANHFFARNRAAG